MAKGLKLLENHRGVSLSLGGLVLEDGASAKLKWFFYHLLGKDPVQRYVFR
jgi:hypothetical protein